MDHQHKLHLNQNVIFLFILKFKFKFKKKKKLNLILIVSQKENELKYFSPLKLNSVTQNIYSHSYLCWGSNKAFDFYHTHSIKVISIFSINLFTVCVYHYLLILFILKRKQTLKKK